VYAGKRGNSIRPHQAPRPPGMLAIANMRFICNPFAHFADASLHAIGACLELSQMKYHFKFGSAKV
jgi:hypothetical protein